MASDNRILYIHSLLVILTIFFQFNESSDVKLSLNWDESTKQSPHFLFLSIDPDLVVDNKTKGFRENFDAINTMSMAAELSPAFLLMGGPTTDKSCFHFESSVFSIISESEDKSNNASSACCYERPRKMVITGEQLLLLSSFAEEAGLKIIITLGYDYNLHHRRLGSDSKDTDDCIAWDEKDAIKLFQFANMMNISLNYQLGYEIRYGSKCIKDCAEEREELQEVARQSGAAYGADVNHLRELLDEYPASKQSLIIPSGIHIPGIAYSNTENNSAALSDLLHSTYTQAYLDECSGNLDAVVWHASTFKDENGQKSTGYNSTAFFREMNKAQQIFGQSAGGKPLWIGETFKDDSSTTPASTDEAFRVALNWVKHLGAASRNRDSAVFHSLKSVGENSPDPKFWVSLLHKNLAGSVVAQTNVRGINSTEEKNSFFAHCTPFSEKYKKDYIESFPRGSVTIYAANPSNNSRNVLLQVGKLKRNDESMNYEVYEFILTPEELDRNYTGRTKLNGIVLEMSSNGIMPLLYPNIRSPWKHRHTRSSITRITRKSVEKLRKVDLVDRIRKSHRAQRNVEAHDQLQLYMPPMSIVFWVIPHDVIGETPCMEEEEDTEKKIQQFMSFSNRPSKTDEESAEDLTKPANDEGKPREKRQIQRSSLSEISKRRIQARKIRPFANRRRKTLIKSLDKEKREVELEQPDLGFNLRRKRKSKYVPKTVSFDIDDSEEEPELVEDGYEKGMLTLSEVVALSSKETVTSDDSAEETGKRKFKPGVLKGIWNLGKKLSDKASPKIYNRPSTHIMGLGGKAKPIAVNNEPRRELFEADIRGWDDDEDDSNMDQENDESKEDGNYDSSDDYEDDEDELIGQSLKSMKDKTKVNGLQIVDKDQLGPEDIDSYLSDEYDEEEFVEEEHQNLSPSSKKGKDRMSKAEEKQYFRRYKRNVANVWNDIWDMNRAPAKVEKYGSKRYARKAPLVTEDSEVKKKSRVERVIKMKDIEGDAGREKASSVVSVKDSPESTKEFPNDISGNYKSHDLLELETGQMNEVYSNDISESFKRHGGMPILDGKLYSPKGSTLNSDGDDEMLTGGNNDDVKRLERQIPTMRPREMPTRPRLLPIDRRLNWKVPLISGRELANSDVISRQLTSPQDKAEGNAPNASQSQPDNAPRPNDYPEDEPMTSTTTTTTTTTTASPIPPRRMSDASRWEQRRISMEAMRRRTAEERRKAMREYRQMLEQRRQRRGNSTQDQAITIFKEGLERTVEGFIYGQRNRREIDQARPEDYEQERTEPEMPEKARKKRQSLMYDDSEGADHHRVIREIRNILKGKPAAVTLGSKQEMISKNPPLDEIWPVDKEFGNIGEGRYRSEKLSTYSPEKWRQVLRNEPRKSNYFSVDTDKAFEPGLYDVINNMLESVSLSKMDLDLIDRSKSHHLSGKDGKVPNSAGKGRPELEDIKQDEIVKGRSSLLKFSQSGDMRKSIKERIQKAKEERRKALEKKSREIRSVDYDLNKVLDDGSLLTNKISKHKKTMSDKAKMLFYMLDENKVDPEKGNALELHLQNIIGVERHTPVPKVDLRTTLDKRNTVDTNKIIPEKDDKTKQLKDQLALKGKEARKKIEEIKAGLPNNKVDAKNSMAQKETSVIKSDDTFFSHILQQLFKLMESLHMVMSSPIR